MALNFTGLFAALFMLFAIGIGFLWVIKLEYYLGARVWKSVLALGLLLCLLSLFLPGFWPSALLGITGGSIAWGATELPEQEKRVQRGLFPANPRRQEKLHARPDRFSETCQASEITQNDERSHQERQP